MDIDTIVKMPALRYSFGEEPVSKSGLDEAEFSKLHGNVKCGDIVGVTGFPGKTKRGELSIFPRAFIFLSHCLHMMPRKAENIKAKKPEIWVPGETRNPETYVLKDQESRYRQRHLDLMLNGEVHEIFRTRANIISYIRRFLDNMKFLEELDYEMLIKEKIRLSAISRIKT